METFVLFWLHSASLWQTCSSMATRTVRRVYLSLGSNVGDRAENLRRAIWNLASAGIRALRFSSLYETQPLDFPAQHWFLNCVVEAETQRLPLQLLHALRRIEFHLGSRKLFACGPRKVDLDVLLYGRATIRTREFSVPHPRMQGRRFVLVPLAEVAPVLAHPLWGTNAAGLLARAADRSQVRKVASAR
jgi:2-amino-4-hydroxy-6-hydroxymethyldihydropteridine diphosphokinase